MYMERLVRKHLGKRPLSKPRMRWENIKRVFRENNCDVTHFTEQSPSWEANGHWASQEFPRLLRNPKVHYRDHKSPPEVPILSQMNPVHTLPPFSPKIHSNIIFQSTPRSAKWSRPFRFPNQNSVHVSHLFRACYMPRPSSLMWSP